MKRMVAENIVMTKGKVSIATDRQMNCNHCGGLMRVTPDEVVCQMCGRSSGHVCENCMNVSKGQAA